MGNGHKNLTGIFPYFFFKLLYVTLLECQKNEEIQGAAQGIGALRPRRTFVHLLSKSCSVNKMGSDIKRGPYFSGKHPRREIPEGV